MKGKATGWPLAIGGEGAICAFTGADALLTDIEIARAARKLPIQEIGAKLAIPAADLIPYGHDKAKIGAGFLRSLSDRPDGKLILVTAINPTPAGEGKTTTTVGLGDALNHIGRKAIVCLREPSLGPASARRAARRAAARRRSYRWRTSTSISPAISMRSRQRTICSPR